MMKNSFDSAPKFSLKWKIGQMLVVGFGSGEEGLASLRHTIETTLAGNIILFSRNTPNAATTAKTVYEARSIIESFTHESPLVAIDQEGGIVMRLRAGVIPIPGAMAQSAALLGKQIALSDIEKLGAICGEDLAALGINWNLAPVVDVNVNPKNPVIGVRSYGEDPQLVADCASAFARGLRSSGVLATAKHFPGHGDTAIDSHLAMPLIPHSLDRLNKVELIPFRRLIAEGLPSVMTAHVRFPAVEPEPLPATFSPKVVEGLLRGELGFKGLVCSDCMEMKAVAEGFADPYVMAVKAGLDMLIISHTPEKQREAAESILRAVESGEIPESRIDASVSRILACKETLRQTARKASNDGRPLAEKISRASLTTLHASEQKPKYSTAQLPRQSASHGIFIDVAPGNLTGVEDASALPSIAATLDKRAVAWCSIRLSPAPSDAEIDQVAARSVAERADDTAQSSACLALSLFAPLAHEGQIKLLARCARLMAEGRSPFLLFLMRSPYDCGELTELCKKNDGADPSVIAAYEYTELSANSVVDFLLGKSGATGICPVTIAPHTVH